MASTKAEEPKKREDKTVGELKRELAERRRRDNEKKQKSASPPKKEKKGKQSKKKNEKQGQGQKQSQKQKQREKENESESTKSSSRSSLNSSPKTARSNKGQTKTQKVDKKLVKKFNKDCLGQNKSIPLNNDTMKMILFGLSQKENILLRDENNYEKIAKLLVGVLLNEQNKKIDLEALYDVIYSKSNLKESEPEFLALVLEILSLYEQDASCLAVVHAVDTMQILSKYLAKTPGIESGQTMQEFDEYGLQYVYPLRADILEELKKRISLNMSMEEALEYLVSMRSKERIYSNYQTLHLLLSYIMKRFYFEECAENDEERNEEFAKELISSVDKSAEKKTLAKIVRLLCFKNDDKKDDDEEEEDEEDDDDDDDDEVDSHSMLILSSMISISGEMKNGNNGLVSLLKAMEDQGLIKYNAIQKFVQSAEDKYTQNRLSALSKMADWITDLDARMARIRMEKDLEASDEEEMDDGYTKNIWDRKHKTAADYDNPTFFE